MEDTLLAQRDGSIMAVAVDAFLTKRVGDFSQEGDLTASALLDA